MRILVLCTGNSARSQMAEGLLRHFCPTGTTVVSAGTAPTHLHPESVTALAELGIDISRQRSKHVDSVAAEPFDVLITVCDQAREACPVLPGVPRRVHWGLPDPAAVADPARQGVAFRMVRDTLLEHVRQFAAEVSAARGRP